MLPARRTALALATMLVATPALADADGVSPQPGWMDAALARAGALVPDRLTPSASWSSPSWPSLSWPSPLWPSASLPSDLSWWTDAAVATAGIGTTVGTAAYACGVIASPGGPIVAGLATGACAGLGSLGGTELVRSGYAFFGLAPDEDALATGRFVGTLAGTALALGVGDLGEGARWALVARRATDRALARLWTRPIGAPAAPAAPAVTSAAR